MVYLKPKSVTALVVTYGDRRKYLKDSLDSLRNFGSCLKNIVLVQNGDNYDLKDFLEKEVSVPLTMFHLLVFHNNMGSSGGFGSGIEVAKKMDGDFLFILDDDNMLPPGVLENLQKLNMQSLEEEYKSQVAISFYRPQHDQDSRKFKRNFDFITRKYVKNTVAEFSIAHKFFKKRYFQNRVNPSTAELFFAPYSGLLIKKKLLKLVPSVFQEFYLYGDDTRLTSQLSYAGVQIISMKSIYTMDLENSWYQSNKQIEQQKNAIELFLTSEDLQNMWRPYYTLRNEIYNSKTLHRSNFFMFYLNLFLLLVAPLFLYLPKNKRVLKNYKYYLAAMHNGLRGRLGKIPENFFDSRLERREK